MDFKDTDRSEQLRERYKEDRFPWKLGIELEDKRNAANEAAISAAGGGVTVRVIHTDEEQMIARSVWSIFTRAKNSLTDSGWK